MIAAAGLNSDGTFEAPAADAIRQRDLLLERERIAGALQDAVVRRIFEVGLALDGALPLIDNPAATQRITHARTVLQDTLKEIRNVVHDLNVASPTPEDFVTPGS